MHFVERFGNGFSLGWYSLWFPFKHGRIWLLGILAVFLSGMTHQLNTVLIAQPTLLCIVGLFISLCGVFIVVTIIRIIISVFQQRHISFFEAFHLNGKQFLLCVLLALAQSSLPIVPQVLQIFIMFFLFLFVYYIPVLLYNTHKLTNVLHLSLLYFFRNIVELITAFTMVMAIAIPLLIMVSLLLISFIGFAIFKAPVHELMMISPKILLSIILISCFGVWFYLSLMALIASSYYYIAHDRTNPYTERKNKK